MTNTPTPQAQGAGASEKERFEAWFTKSGDYEPEWLVGRMVGNEYLYFSAETENMWQAFQAGAALATKATEPAPAAAAEVMQQFANEQVSLGPEIAEALDGHLWDLYSHDGNTPQPATRRRPMTGDQVTALARRFNAKVSDVPYDGITFTRSQLLRFAAALSAPAVVADAITKAIDAFEQKERGAAQAHIAAKLVQELRAALSAGGTA